MFLVRSKVKVRLIPTYNSHAIRTFSITAYLFLALYGSTTSQSRSFFKNIKNSLCNQKLVNNRSIPSMHAKRKITIHSHKHSFTLYPSLSAYSQTDRMMDGEQIQLLCVGWRNFFPVVVLCQLLVLAGNRFWFTYLCTQSTIQLWCCFSFLVAVGNSFWCYIRLVYNTVVLLCQFFGCGGKQISK